MKTRETGDRPAGGLNRAAQKLWSFFSSIRLALVLILTITGLSLLGAFLTEIDIFHSWWFLTIGALLMLNILVCSLNRWGSIKAVLSGGPVKHGEDYYIAGNTHTELEAISLPKEESAQISAEQLRRQGYRVRIENAKNNVYIAADKNRFFKACTYISHLSLILFVLAYLLGSFLGFRESGFTVTEGDTRAVGHNTELSLQLISFADEYYPDGTPKDYRSEVILYENGREVKQALIRVNYPLTYNGIRFYQAFFGQSVKIQVRQNGNVIYQGNVVLSDTSQIQGEQFYLGYFDLPGTGLFVRLISPSTAATDSMIPAGQLAVDLRDSNGQIALKLVQKNTPLTISGLEFTYQSDARFSGFQVSRDPANALIWIAAALFVIGVMLVLYFPHRQVWILAQPRSPGACRLLIRIAANRGFSNTAELNTLVSQIEKNLPAGKGR